MSSVLANPDGWAPAVLETLIDAIGGDGFGHALLRFVRGAVDVDSISVHELRRDGNVGWIAFSSNIDPALWHRANARFAAIAFGVDPLHLKSQAIRARRYFSLHLPIAALTHPVSRDYRLYSRITDRFSAAFGSAESYVCCDFFRREFAQPFTQADIDGMRRLAPLVHNFIRKHVEVVRLREIVSRAARPDFREILDAVAELTGTRLSTREREICLRILEGQSAEDIAAGFGIKPTSVATFRRRAYQKLGVEGRVDLFTRCMVLRAAAEPRG